MKINGSVRRLAFGVPYVTSDIALQILSDAGRIKRLDKNRGFSRRQWEAPGAKHRTPAVERQTPNAER
ncbi:MAG: hypothetical protein JO271_01340 [Verrucomicrobia bacterium]|nr:hypothetical protein [Verrucomicrobiota bacterium]MBV9276280.1 hypothetical protein [Verrucomicrobiota bacterium]